MANSTNQNQIFRKLIYSLAFAVVVYLIMVIWGSRNDLALAFSKFNWTYAPIILLLALANYILRFIKWQYYLNILAIVIPRKSSFLIHMSGLAFSITPGKLGEVVKSYFLKKGFGQPISKTAPIVLADRLADLLALVILCLVGSTGFSYAQTFIRFFGLVIVLLLLAITIRPIGQVIITFLLKFKFLKKRAGKIQTLYNSSADLLRWERLFIPLTISIISWGLEAIAFYLVFLGFGLELSISAAIFIYSFSTIIGAVSMLPGGLGSTEGMIAGLLRLVKIDSGVAVLATLIIRVATLWFAVLLGLIFLGLTEQKFNSNLEQALAE